MGSELISVLMVNYNHEETIGETIESVLSQTYSNIQFIIVDDGSTDNSCNVIKKYNDSRIELYRLEKNCHICQATNYGLTKVRGKYLARIDSDDIWYPGKLERQINFLKEDSTRDICFSWIDLIDENGNNINEECGELVRLFETNYKGQEEWLHTFYFIGNCLSHPSVLMKTKVMNEIGGFELGYMQAHDFDYWIRIAKQFSIYIIPERLLAMRRFVESVNKGKNNSNDSIECNTRFFNEFTDIRAHFFDDMDNALFRKTFGTDFINKNAKTELELECEKAFLMCRPICGEKGIPPAGIRRLHELFRRPEAVSVLEDIYNFRVQDLYQLTGKHLYCDKMWNKRLEKALEDCQRLQDKVERLEEENKNQKRLIQEYAESTTWKIMAPFREVGRAVKKMSAINKKMS
ncbi:glycosyltransferase [Faecalicatena sp. AGMB00832]|uniref:Glycosyltransferase n=1 Tax=Faecalicatena faecalis TaxID=2726362 RepID=A0ABS6CZJ7_9FIRM|nr:glycosyltransferase [Faecalicatena faecalis]MBU3874743.1 glycosyltransferase [Faecalicatena faecalis]